MDERMRRQWAATEASDLGWGGITTVSLATGLARNTIMAGAGEVAYRQAHPKAAVRVGIRGPGGGRKPLTETDPGLQRALEAADEAISVLHFCHSLRLTGTDSEA